MRKQIINQMDSKRCQLFRQLYHLCVIVALIAVNGICRADGHSPTGTDIDDETGVLVEVRRQIREWQEKEEYAHNWNQMSMDRYRTPSSEEKQEYLGKKMLRYLEKSVASAAKRESKKGDSAAGPIIRGIDNALHSSGQMAVSDEVKVKLKTKALKGEARVILENSYMDLESTASLLNGDISVHAGKRLESIGLAIGNDYSVSNGRYIASVSKQLTDTISTKISSHHNVDNFGFEPERSEQVVMILFSISF